MSRHVNVAVSHSSLSLQHLMTLFTLFIILAVIILNSWIVYNAHERTLQTIEKEADNLSVSLSRHAEDTFLQVELLLQDLKERVTQDGFGEQQLARLQTVLKDRKDTLPQLDGIFIYDAAGYWLATSNNSPQQKINYSDRDYFKYHQTHDDKELHISRIIVSRSTGNKIIPVSMRLSNPDGTFAGVLVATIPLNYFKQYYGYYSLGKSDVLTILLSDGYILYRRPYQDSTINQDISGSALFKDHTKFEESGTITFTSPVDNIERIYGYTHLKRYPIVVAAGYNKAEALSDWKLDSSIYAVITLTMLLTISAMSLMVLRQIKVNLKNQKDLTAVRDQLTAVNHTLETLALLDGLTGLANRRQFDIFLKETIAQSALSGKKMALIILDVDMFKKYNDRYGHVEGDKCLRTISDVLSSMPRRKEDLVARYGGEEFVIILLDVTEQGAETFAQRALDAIRQHRIPHAASLLEEKIVTASAGVYVFIGGQPPQSAENVISQADRALYQAKNSGRNRVVLSTQGKLEPKGKANLY